MGFMQHPSRCSEDHFYLKIISKESKLVIVKEYISTPSYKESSETYSLIFYVQMNTENWKLVLNIKNNC